MATVKTVLALVLVDIIAHGLKAGVLVEASPDLIKSLASSGQVDSHKDAVAHAKASQAPIVRSAVEQQAESKAAEIDAALVEIAKLEDLMSKADETTKHAIQGQLDAKRTDLEALRP